MSRLQANFLLLTAAAMWGFGNVAQKTVLDHLDPSSAVAMRCLIGGLLVLPFVSGERRTCKARGYWLSIARVVALFAAALIVQQISYFSASVTNASFLVNTYTVMTPLAAWLMAGERPMPIVWCAAGATMVGAILLCGGLGSVGRGDLIALLSAVCYALWMVELGRHMQAHGHPFTTAATQFLGAAALILPFGAAFGRLSPSAALEAGVELVILGVFSTALPFGIQTAAQRFTPASHAVVIVSATGVFGALGGAMVFGERLSAAGALGAAIMLGAILRLALSAGPDRLTTAMAASPEARS